MDNPKENAIAGAIILTTVAVITLAFIAGKELLEFLGLKDDKQDKEKAAEQQILVKGASDQVKAKIAKGERPSYLDAQYKDVAQTIHNATNKSALDDQNQTAIDKLLRFTPKDVDYLKIQEAYGSRLHHWFGIPKGYRTLTECLQQELSGSQKDFINKQWKSRKMQSRIN